MLKCDDKVEVFRHSRNRLNLTFICTGWVVCAGNTIAVRSNDGDGTLDCVETMLPFTSDYFIAIKTDY